MITPTAFQKEITPAFAMELLDGNYKRNRKINNKHVNYLAEQMLTGMFIPNSAISIAILDGDYILIDGQHRLKAVVKSGISYSSIIHQYVTRREEDVFRLYANFDTGKPRKFSDQIIAFGFDDEMGLQVVDIKRLWACLQYMHDPSNNGGSYKFKFPVERAMDMCRQWESEYKLYKCLISSSELSTKLSSAPIMASALITIKFQKELAIEFWSQVGTEDSLKHGDPRKTLNKFVSMHALSARKNGTQLTITRPNMFSTCNKAWNKWTSGQTAKQVRRLKARGMTYPINTPYDGTYESVMSE